MVNSAPTKSRSRQPQHFRRRGRRLHRLAWLGACVLVAGGAAAGRGEPDHGGLDLADLELRLERLRRKEHSLREVLDRDQSEMEQLKKRLIARGRAYYRLSRGAPSGDLFDYAVQVERLRQALLFDMERFRALEKKNRKLGQGLSRLEEHRAPLEVERQAAGQARDALLSKQERERAFELAFSSSKGVQDHTAVYSAADRLDPMADSFADLLGRLPFPLPGRAEVEEVRREYADGPGLVLTAAPGIAARSVYRGRVGFADDYPEYGQTVILDHGDGYFTVTSGLASIDVEVGEELPAGSRLGTCASEGSVGRIYFEIRHGRRTLSPGEWFGI